MSDNSSGGVFGFARLIIFLVLLVIAAPFLAVGSYKNGRIQEGIDGSLDKMKRYDFIEAQKKMDEAGEHFGFLYDCYVLALPLVGGKYYEKKTYYGLRGVVRTGGLAHRMAKWDLDVDDLITEVELDLNRRSVFPDNLKSLQTMAKEQVQVLQKLLPIMKECKKNNYDKVFADLRVFMSVPKNVYYEVVVMPLTSLLVELSQNTRDGPTINMTKAIVKGMTEKTKNPFFRDMRMKVDSMTVQAESSYASRPKKTSLKDKFSTGMTLYKKKQYEKAMKEFEACYGERPDNDKICYALALTKKRMGQNEEAKKLCQEILLRQPENKTAKKLLASIK